MITQDTFGTLPDGQEVYRYNLTNKAGVSVSVLNLGAIIQRWLLADEQKSDVVLGFDDLQGYLNDECYIGATIGRYANRIAKGQFTLKGETYQLPANLAGNTLHGGTEGFDKRIWDVQVLSEQQDPSIELSLTSPDGDQGFPGTLNTKVCFTLTEDNCLRIEYQGESDADTVFNPTQHSYFNLGGQDSGPVTSHQLQVMADHFTPADETGIPTGEVEAVTGSAFDLREMREIQTLLAQDDPRLKMTNGLDHNWCLNLDTRDGKPTSVAKVVHPSGKSMEVKTTMPGMQVYTANFLGEGMKGKAGASYGPYHAFCLETQFYPDAPNKPGFPSATLEAGKAFKSVTEYWVSF